MKMQNNGEKEVFNIHIDVSKTMWVSVSFGIHNWIFGLMLIKFSAKWIYTDVRWSGKCDVQLSRSFYLAACVKPDYWKLKSDGVFLDNRNSLVGAYLYILSYYIVLRFKKCDLIWADTKNEQNICTST